MAPPAGVDLCILLNAYHKHNDHGSQGGSRQREDTTGVRKVARRPEVKQAGGLRMSLTH